MSPGGGVPVDDDRGPAINATTAQPPPTTTATGSSSCALQRAPRSLSPGRAKALSPTARIGAMAVRRDGEEGVHLPFKGMPRDGGGSHNHLPSSSSFKNLSIIVDASASKADAAPPAAATAAGSTTTGPIPQHLLMRRVEDLECENQRLRRLVEQLTAQQAAAVAAQAAAAKQQPLPQRILLRTAPPSTLPRLSKAKAASTVAGSSGGKATPSKGGSTGKKYPLGISRFSWPPGSPTSTVGRSLADLDKASSSQQQQQQQEEKLSGASRTPRPSSSLARTPLASRPPAAATPSAAAAAKAGGGGAAGLHPLHFTEFAMAGVKRAVLRGEEPPQRSVQPVEALEIVMLDAAQQAIAAASGSSGSSSSEGPSGSPPPSASAALEKITEFCFPQGGRLELAPASQLELYTGKHRDSTHILLFTDEFGTTSYGVCVTVWEPHPECPPSVVEALRQLQREDMAARAIQLFWRETLARPPIPARPRSASTASASAAAEDALDSSEVGWVRRGLLTRMMRRRLQGPGGLGANEGGAGWGTPRAGKDRGAAGSPSLSSSPRTPPAPPRMGRADSSALEEYQRHVRAADGEHGPSPRYGGLAGSGRLSSLREVADSEAEEMVVVAPRCFCLMSDQPNHGALMKLLQIIVDREREQAAGGARRLGANKALSALKRRHSCNALASSPPTTSGGFLASGMGGGGGGTSARPGTGAGDLASLRRRFLEFVQTELCSAGGGSSGGGSGGGSVTISYPSYSPAPARVDLPLVPLEEWTCAVLFSRVSADVIVKIVNLLLLEQSLVIVGEDLGLVSAIATALISLLAPFKWDNPFVPALPAGLSDFLQSPVPYIVGTAATPEFDPTRATPHAAVLHLGRCREHLRLPDVKLPLPHAYQLLQEVHDATRVFAGRRSRCWANLHLATYMSGLTSDETRALAAVKGVFRRYVENLCGDIKYPQAWRKYGYLNAETDDFAFEPAWFLAPLEVVLQFQSALVRTQMLAHYIEKRRAEDRHEEERVARCRRFLAQWLAFRVRRRRLNRGARAVQQQQPCTEEEEDSGDFAMMI